MSFVKISEIGQRGFEKGIAVGGDQGRSGQRIQEAEDLIKRGLWTAKRNARKALKGKNRETRKVPRKRPLVRACPNAEASEC